MADTLNIEGRVAGDDWTLIHTVTDLPQNMAIVSGRLIVKASMGALDSAALITKNISTSGGAVSQTGTTVTLTFGLSQSDTALLRPGTPYFYSISMADSNGVRNTPALGTILPL